MTRPVPGLDPALVARFGVDLTRTLGGPMPQGASLALAVSGGPDSMAMLALATAAFPGQIRAATVDHGLRPAAVDEAAMVARWCAAANVPHRTLVLRESIGRSRIQETARALRYDLLGRWVTEIGAVALATAHHVEDQAETQFKTVVSKYPKHKRASYAQNLLGRSYLDDDKPSLASLAFYDSYKNWPDGDRAPESLFYLAQALVKLDKPAAQVCKVYTELQRTYGAKVDADARMKAGVAKGRAASNCS